MKVGSVLKLRLNGNIRNTAGKMGCARNTIYLALVKEGGGDLKDKPHIPKTKHPQTTPEVVKVI
jgi:hypothetical protein